MRGPEAPSTHSYATLSSSGLYRYELGRTWGAFPARLATFVMLNPSTADHQHDDPTIRRCMGFARSWGLDGIVVVNLYAFRATDPSMLWTADDPVGPENDETLGDTFRRARGTTHPVVAAWGANARPERVAQVVQVAREVGVTLTALGVTKNGAPRHPLYMKASCVPEPWAPQ